MRGEKKMRAKRLFAGILVIAMLCVCGCADTGTGSAPAAEDTEKILYENGLEITALMNEMLHSPEYISMMISSSEINEIIDEVAVGNYNKPQKVYQIDFSQYDEMFWQALGAELGGFSDNLKKEVEEKTYDALVNIINAREGAKMLAAASIIHVNSIFVCSSLTENRQYLYMFEGGYPIVISYTIGKDGAVVAYGSFLLMEELKNTADETIADLLGEAIGLPMIELREVEIG